MARDILYLYLNFLAAGALRPAVHIMGNYQEVDVKRIAALLLMLTFVVSLAAVIGCEAKPKGDPLVGTWGMADNPSKTIKISKEGEQYFYEGSQGKSPANKIDDNTLKIPMGPIEVDVVLDPASGVLTVSFMGEKYGYKKVQ